MIYYVKGDLFTNKYKVEAFAHGCNVKGYMGKGIARQFRTKFPNMYKTYKRICHYGGFAVGNLFTWDKGSVVVYNLATQHSPGSNAKYEHIRNALISMRKAMGEMDIKSVAMPRIGCGLGGLDWNQVKNVIDQVFADWDGDVYVYEEYIKEKR